MKSNYIILQLILVFLSHAATSQSLDSLLLQAYNNNPELKAIQLDYEAALKKGPQVSQLPDPTLGIGIPVLRPETRLGQQVLGISVQQMFPWFGTLKAKEDVVLTMAKSKYEMLAAERLNIDYEIKTAYYNLYLLQAKQDVYRKNIRIFKTIEKVALAKVESGKSISSDVLSVQIKIEDLQQQVQILEIQKQAFIAKINEALNNPIDKPIQVDTSEIYLAELAYDLDRYKQNISLNHPLVNIMSWRTETSNKALELNELEGKPSFGIGLDYSMVNNRTDALPTNNGRDILIPKVMATIPLYRKKYAAKREEEMIKKDAYALKKEQITNALLSNIQVYNAEYQSAKLLYDLANSQIEISNSAYDILLTYYSSQGQRFDELMKLQSDLNSYQIELLKAIVQTHLAKFKIERLTDF